jgi:hypothetical protein
MEFQQVGACPRALVQSAITKVPAEYTV